MVVMEFHGIVFEIQRKKNNSGNEIKNMSFHNLNDFLIIRFLSIFEEPHILNIDTLT